MPKTTPLIDFTTRSGARSTSVCALLTIFLLLCPSCAHARDKNFTTTRARLFSPRFKTHTLKIDFEVLKKWVHISTDRITDSN